MSSKKKTTKKKSRKLSHMRTSKRGRDFRSKSKGTAASGLSLLHFPYI